MALDDWQRRSHPSDNSPKELDAKSLDRRHYECPIEVVVVLLAGCLSHEQAAVTSGSVEGLMIVLHGPVVRANGIA